MYKQDKRRLWYIFIVVFILSFSLDVHYSKIAEQCISLVSISMAVYIAATSVLLGSSYAKVMDTRTDEEIPTKTSLGVLTSYLRTAGSFGVVSIAISVLYVLDIGAVIMNALPATNKFFVAVKYLIPRLASAISCFIFAANIIFMYFILIFLINSISKSVNEDNSDNSQENCKS